MKYALINGIESHIDDVERGTKGMCPICEDILIAKKGELKSYFAHSKNKGIHCELKYETLKKFKLSKEKQEIKLSESNNLKDIYNNVLNNEVDDVQGFTDEQLAVINSKERRVMVNSVAGSGKSSVAEEYIRRNPNKKIIYLVFNRAMSLSAIERFNDAENVEIRTIHSYAYKYFGKDYKSLLKNDINIFDIAKAVNFFMKDPEDFMIINEAKLLFEEYLTSDSYSVNEFALNTKYKTKIDITRQHVLLLNKLFEACKNKKCNITHNFYYKLFHLSKPNFKDYDTLIIDEVQDVNSGLIDMIKHNTEIEKIIVIGDEKQSIYNFANCVNGFNLLGDEWKEYKLTKSFRIGNTNANIIKTVFSKLYKENFNIVGYNKNQNIVEKIDESKPYFEICRYNSTIITKVIKRAAEGHKIYITGGKAGISFNHIKNVFELKFYNKKHFTLKQFEDYNHMIAYATKVDDRETLFIHKLIENYGEGLIMNIRSAEENMVDKWEDATVCFSTAHKQKGNTITIPIKVSNDFEDIYNPNMQNISEEDLLSEINLMYVVLTRPKNKIELPKTLINYYLQILDTINTNF